MAEGTVVDTKVKEKRNITLTCEASGMFYHILTKEKLIWLIFVTSQLIEHFGCLNVPGNPVPEIKWLKDGLLLVPDRHHQILSHGRFLQISEAQVADTGRYSCLASNSAGDRSRHYNLNVLGTKTSSVNSDGNVLSKNLVA